MEASFFENPTGLIAGILIAATLAAIPISYLILRRYSEAVGRTMRQGGELAEGDSPAPASGNPLPLRLEILEGSQEDESSVTSTKLLERLYREPRALARAYILAGAVYSLLATLILLPANQIEYSVVRIIAVSLVFLWPVVPQVVNVAVAHRGLKIAGPIGFLLLALLLGWAISKETAIAIYMLWAGMMIAPTLTQIAISHRRIRNVGPFVTGFLVVLLFGIYCTLCLILVVGIGANWFVLLVTLLGLGCVFPVAHRLVRRIARAYQAKRMSDQMLLIDVWWVIYTSWMCVFLTITLGWWGVGVGVLPFVAARVALALALRGRRMRTAHRESARLLLLRVFGFRKRTETLLEDLGHHWRHAGSIQLIAAPDVAQTALEPHELLDYVGGRLSRAFVRDERELEQRISQLDDHPDPDGRYRINEIFCQEHTWKSALQRLVSMSHVVLLDLRGFSPENRGCIYEICQLVDIVPASQFLLMTDDTTDQACLEDTLEYAWQRMSDDSPNRDPGYGSVRIRRLSDESPAAVRAVISDLCQSVSL